ncbi:hypothetical protein POM88_050463 [Heracleum sosnowskyi]|uniref:Uncharacterized protein n=1 Tax=Heracleum sosnowskyi TaxID=360622 RepID=A0AAD8H037_9APIA|nr:hypothetical protein POM88_050463 [Heracleum sosnowskyi]
MYFHVEDHVTYLGEVPASKEKKDNSKDSESLESDCLWDLPVLTTLHLICPPHMSNYKLPKSSLINLPVLIIVCLDRVEMPESLSSFSLPALTTLTMRRYVSDGLLYILSTIGEP